MKEVSLEEAKQLHNEGKGVYLLFANGSKVISRGSYGIIMHGLNGGEFVKYEEELES